MENQITANKQTKPVRLNAKKETYIAIRVALRRTERQRPKDFNISNKLNKEIEVPQNMFRAELSKTKMYRLLGDQGYVLRHDLTNGDFKKYGLDLEDILVNKKEAEQLKVENTELQSKLQQSEKIAKGTDDEAVRMKQKIAELEAELAKSNPKKR